ncbi:MAG: long-chain fatty acid--CoA ligase [SAR324 cluster bacterium]|nr:long-chain fatty acid--CoA ligase [SAR324 cluster bacterium]
MDGLIMDYQLTIDKMIKRANRVFPDKEIVSVLPSGAKHRYTYSDLYRRTVRLMNVLRGLGVGRGHRVATFMWNDYRHLELYFAIPSLGAVTHTLNIRLFSEQLSYIVNHAEDMVIFADATLLGPLEEIAPQLKSVRQYVVVSEEGKMPETSLSPLADYETLMADAEDDEDFPELSETDACGLCYTSGTTGKPKGALYSHRGIYVHTLMAGMVDMLGIGERDVLLPVVPMFHANAWSAPFICAMVGAKLVYAGQNVQPEALVPLMQEEGVTFAMGVPTIWSGMLQHLRQTGGNLGRVKKLVVGGSSVPRAMIEAFKREHGIDIIHAWGMTEMSPLGSLNRLLGKMEDWPEDRQFGALSRVGKPAPCVEMKIVDDAGRELPWDGRSSGELLVRGPTVIRSYYKNAEAADQFTDDGWFRTGDVVTIDENALLQITDRTKDLIKSGGEWISSVEMENAIMACPGVMEAAVVARPDAKWDERPVAFVVRQPDADPPQPEQIIAHLRNHFAKWQLPAPADIRFIEHIPRTSVGKFDKKVLRSQLA